MAAASFERLQNSLLSVTRRQVPVYGRAAAEEMWSHGFLPNKTRLYAIDELGPDAYLSDLQRFSTQLNGPYKRILDNKAVFDQVFAGAVPTVPLLGYTARGRYVGDLPRHGVVYAKPVVGASGVGVFRATIDGDRVTVRNRITTRAAFIDDLVSRGTRSKGYILTEAVTQHPEMSRFFDRTVNTVRVMMMRPPAGGEGFVAAAVLRVGAGRTRAVDNFGRGGISFHVDLDTGAIGSGWQKSGARMQDHPDTGQQIAGRRVPMWADVLETCQKAFEHCRHLVYVGWDVIVTSDGPVVLEGNNSSDVNLLQVHRPLLIDERVRDFYDYHGILDIRPTKPLYEPEPEPEPEPA